MQDFSNNLLTFYIEAVSGRREVINSAVQTDVNQIFRGKTHTQLIALQNQIKDKIKSGGSIDVGE